MSQPPKTLSSLAYRPHQALPDGRMNSSSRFGSLQDFVHPPQQTKKDTDGCWELKLIKDTNGAAALTTSNYFVLYLYATESKSHISSRATNVLPRLTVYDLVRSKARVNGRTRSYSSSTQQSVMHKKINHNLELDGKHAIRVQHLLTDHTSMAILYAVPWTK